MKNEMEKLIEDRVGERKESQCSSQVAYAMLNAIYRHFFFLTIN
jgi:hypothetical protein